ncbi:MAG: MCE family protein [Fimbriimonadaceae bacterium]|nr:MCE family protein [Chitinophagales bacterium]
MKFSKEIRVGLLVAISIVILLLGFNWLKGNNIFNTGTDYQVVYSNANGLQRGDHVLIDGFEIGKVKEINLQSNQRGVNVILNVTEDIKIPVDSKAVIGGDLLGEKYVQIQLGTSTVIAKEKALFLGEVEDDVQGQIKLLSGKINAMITSIDTTINVLSSIFTESLKDDFAKSITGIKQTLESFNNSAAKFNAILVREEPRIEEIITNVSSTTDFVNKSEVEVTAILENLKSLSDSLNSVQWQELAKELDKAVESITIMSDKINSGQGTLGMMVNDKDLYKELTQTLSTLDSVLAQFGNNPEIRLILFGGKKDKKPG